MNALVRLVLALAAAALAALPAAAQQLYKYVGPDGKVQYSDRPPPGGQKAEKITGSRVSSIGPGSGTAAAAASGDAAKSSAPKTAAEQEQAFRQRKAEAEEKAKKGEKVAQEQQQQAEACANARRDLSGVQSGQRVARLNEAGERIFLDDSGVQNEIARLQRDVAANCK
jgi:Skp family chaperone for outer membrane proteins